MKNAVVVDLLLSLLFLFQSQGSQIESVHRIRKDQHANGAEKSLESNRFRCYWGANESSRRFRYLVLQKDRLQFFLQSDPDIQLSTLHICHRLA